MEISNQTKPMQHNRTNSYNLKITHAHTSQMLSYIYIHDRYLYLYRHICIKAVYRNTICRLNTYITETYAHIGTHACK